jgi:uncharacterized membrane protein YdjX (TVP38/TMEM64 family)
VPQEIENAGADAPNGEPRSSAGADASTLSGRQAGLSGVIRHPAARLAVFAVVAAGLFWLASIYAVSSTDLRKTVENWGLVAPVAYGALGAGLIVAFVPLAVVSGVAGLVVGTAVGFPVALLAATAGAGMTFLLGRWLGRSAIDELQGERLAQMRAWITERGVVAVIVARVAPIPTGIVNYGGGLTTLPLRAFVAGSLLGFMPRVFAYVAVGGSLENPTSPAMFGALGLLLGVIVIGAVILRRDRRARELSGTSG